MADVSDDTLHFLESFSSSQVKSARSFWKISAGKKRGIVAVFCAAWNCRSPMGERW